MTTIADLNPGDIIIASKNNVPFHAMLYSPCPNNLADLIHVKDELGKDTVAKTMNHWAVNLFNIKFEVFRSKKLDGSAIAKQAEFWLRQGVVFDECRTLNASKQNEDQKEFPDTLALNIFEYLKFAARRNTQPIKTKTFPYKSSFLHSALISLAHPVLSLPSFIKNIGYWVAERDKNNPDRPRGFSCVSFILATIAAVALRDEINAVTHSTGWASLKYGELPDANVPACYKEALDKARKEGGFADNEIRKGLHTLFTKEELANFNLDRLAEKLSPLVAHLNPTLPSIKEFKVRLSNDQEHWQSLGELKTPALDNHFNKPKYLNEKLEIQNAITKNRKLFLTEFGNSIFTKPSQNKNAEQLNQQQKIDNVSCYSRRRG